MQPTCPWLQPGHMGLQPRRHRAAASTAQGYRAWACLAVGADELVVGLVVRLAPRDLHLRPQFAHSTDEVTREVVALLARPHPPHRDRAAAHEHLVHRVRRHLQRACSAHALHMQCTCSAHAVHVQCTVCKPCTCTPRPRPSSPQRPPWPRVARRHAPGRPKVSTGAG